MPKSYVSRRAWEPETSGLVNCTFRFEGFRASWSLGISGAYRFRIHSLAGSRCYGCGFRYFREPNNVDPPHEQPRRALRFMIYNGDPIRRSCCCAKPS